MNIVEKNKHLERKAYLDFIKIIAIYLVCLYHYNNLNMEFLVKSEFGTYRNYFIKCIESSAVPLFFMVNGTLMLNSNKELDLKRHIKKIIRTAILTLLWGIILLLIIAFIRGKEYTFDSFIKSWWTWENGAINHLWFLQALVCIYILFPIIKNLYDREDKKLLSYFLGVTFILSFGNVFLNILYNIYEFSQGQNIELYSNFNYFNNFNIFRGIHSYTIVYFIIGGILSKYLEEKGKYLKLYKLIAIFFIGVFLLFLYGVMMSRSNGWIYDTVWDGYSTIMTMIIAISIFSIAFKLEDILKKFYKILYIIGDNTFGIYLLHVIVGIGLTPIYKSIPKSQSIILNLLYPVIVMTISLILTITLKKIPIIKRLFKI